jgi:Holliday junction resolvasome RuvABC endonuclease subunit
MSKTPSVILSLYPNSRGMGYVCVEWPQKLLDSGVATVRPISNSKLLQRVEKFIEFFRPTILVVRDCEPAATRSAIRAQSLIESIAISAEKANVPVYRYSRKQIREVFEQFGVTTKYQIAQKILEWFPELKWRSPKLRKPWMDEDYNMGVFDALALAIAHKYLSE